ncbi:MAG: GNAT family N-acetyltransferase [Nitrospira sp.]|nr:GNAT family N-acetyltransferase [Nitrospira sp.]
MTIAPATALTIRPLTAASQADFLRFFDGPAFADNPRWASCYCQFPHVDPSRGVWSERTAEQNRAAACERIACGRMQGLLAYRGDEVVGWCNAAPRALLEAFADEPDPGAQRLGQITCFVVAQPHRRAGVARALLDAACEHLREQGLSLAEARPSRKAASDAQHHQGPLSLYLAAGFSVHREDDDGTVVVRRALERMPR